MIRSTWKLLCVLVDFILLTLAGSPQNPLGQANDAETATVPVSLFASFERLARLVDITYCIGNTGISEPFKCISRCKDFPTLSLVQTWNTGILLSDSCGYVAIDHGMKQHDDDDEGRPQIGSPQKAIVIAFRGTYSITNTVVDLSTIPQKYVPFPGPGDGEGGDNPHKCNNCTVHMGFLESWNNARKILVPRLAVLKEMYPSYPIYMVGHSLGGAVASLAALELKVTLGWDKIIVTTFGEPRLGNQALADYVDEVFNLDEAQSDEQSYRRVTHKGDPVPLLPLSEWGYASHGGEFYISKGNLPPSETDLRECTGAADPLCSAEGDRTVTDVLRDIFHRTAQAEDSLGNALGLIGIPTRYKLWQLFFAHRDYFWRLGLCVPGGDPIDWGRDKYNFGQDEL